MHSNNKITAFYAENFKAIEKGTWFELNSLNVLTGANNSGKSTLFQAMKIFTDGFTEGDFPKIEIQKVLPDCGYFNDLLNFNSSNTEYFKVGFRYYSEKFADSFEIIYTFVGSKDNKYAEFLQVEIFKSNHHFMSLIKYPYREGKSSAIQDYAQNFISILDSSDPGELCFFINIEAFSRLLGSDEFGEFIDIFNHLSKSFGEYWSGEILEEEKFYERIHFIRFSDDVVYDLYHDYFCNLYNFDSKYPIFNDDDYGESESKYRDAAKNFDFSNFIKVYFYDLFDEISSEIRFFYNKNLFHIELFDSFQSRILFANAIGFQIPLLKLTEQTDLPNFDEKEEDLTISTMTYSYYWFGFEHKICNWFYKLGLNGAIITNEIESNIYKIFYHDYDLDRSINIADLGKGHARLLQLLLFIAYKLFLLKSVDRGKKKSDKEQQQIIFHIEEPEA